MVFEYRRLICVSVVAGS